MKKTNKENPITFFRKANEARQALVKKSIKKAQDGIETNDDLINKAGSTGGYKTSSLWDGSNFKRPNLERENKFPIKTENINLPELEPVRINYSSPTKQMENETKRMNDVERNKVNPSGAKQARLTGFKKGGAIKRKK